MTGGTYYHGGAPGMRPGDFLIPTPPPIEDDCPVCLARAAGRTYTAGEFRAWAISLGPQGAPLVRTLDGVPDHQPIDPPRSRDAVYITPERWYARWYAASRGGDLYRVEPAPHIPIERSTEDHVPAFTTPYATVVEVLERRTRLTRKDRRWMQKMWARHDRRVHLEASNAEEESDATNND